MASSQGFLSIYFLTTTFHVLIVIETELVLGFSSTNCEIKSGHRGRLLKVASVKRKETAFCLGIQASVYKDFFFFLIPNRVEDVGVGRKHAEAAL